jgi:hypothetical protein
MSLLPKDLYLTFDYFSPLAGDINLKRIGSGPYTRYSTVRDQNHPDYSSVATFTSDSHRGLFPPHGTVQVTVDGPEGRLQSSKMGFQFKYVNGSYLHNSLPRTFKGFSRDISTPYGFNVSIDETLRVSVAQAERLTGLTFTAPSPQVCLIQHVLVVQWLTSVEQELIDTQSQRPRVATSGIRRRQYGSIDPRQDSESFRT